ncbi:alpha/beta fold hydrolase [Hyphomonas sp.]|uniref:alpha/beta hydrolase family protein n=1 Tax=Hyphomonas sp. TaxID=87 RepID=UPI0030F98F3A
MHNLKRLAVAGVSSLCLALGSGAETLNEVAELFGRADAIGNPQISPDGKYLAVECAPQVTASICILPLDSSDAPILLPAFQDVRVVRHYWANNDTLILDIEAFETLQVSSGKEDYIFERAVAFNLTDQKPVMLMKDNRSWLDTNNLVAIAPDETDKIMFSIVSKVSDNEPGRVRTKNGDRATYSVMKTDLKKGSSRQVDSDTRFVVGAVHAPDGTMIAEHRYREVSRGNHEVSITKGKKVLFERQNLSFNPLTIWGLDSSGENLVVFLDEGEPYGLHRMSLDDGTLTRIDLGYESGTVAPVIDSRSLQVVGFELPGDKTMQIFEDPALKSQLEAIAAAMNGAAVMIESWTDDRSQSVIAVEHAGQPIDYYLFEPDVGALSPVGNKAPHLDARPLGQIEAISYHARDGLLIHGYLTLPPGKARSDGPFPLILLPHGGPETKDAFGFDWWAQAYAAAGYAVIQPNFRGSIGYGTDFRDAGYGEFGDKMVTDILDAAVWADDEGVSVSGNACIVGASYGGYAALMAPLHDEAAVRCVVAVNPLTNPFKFLSDYGYQTFLVNSVERFLGVSRFDSTESRQRITPTSRVNEFKVPVLLIAGDQDSTVPFEQSQDLANAARGVADVTLITLDDEDHYLQSTQARFDVLSNSLDFLNAHLSAD